MNWKIFRILFLALFASVLGLGIVVPLLPGYAHQLGATGLHIGIIFGAFSFARSIFLPFIGRLSDIRGRKPFITGGFIVYFVASVGFTTSADVTTLIIIRFLQGVAAAMIMPVVEAYAGEIAPKGKEGLIMGILTASYAGGLCAGPVIGGLAQDMFNIRAAFLLMALITLAGFLLSQIFLPSTKTENVFAKTKAPVTYRELLHNKYIFGLFLFRFTYTLCIGAVWAFAPLLADIEYGLSGLATGIIITIGVIASGILMPLVGFLADRFSKRILLIIGGFFTISAMTLFALMYKSWQLYIVSILLGTADGIAMPCIMAMTVVLGREKDSMGAIMALLTLAESLGMTIGPLIAGIVSDASDMRLAFLICAAMMLVATLITLFLTTGFPSFHQEQEVVQSIKKDT